MQTSAKRESHSPCFIGMAFISANVVAEIVGDPWLTSWAMIPCHRSRTDCQDALHSAKPCNPVLRAPLEVGCGNAALGPSQQSGDIWNFWEPSWVQKFVWKSIPLHQSMESSVTALLRQPEIADHVFQTLISTGHHVWCRKNWGGISGDDPGNTNPLTMWFHSNYSPHATNPVPLLLTPPNNKN